MKCLMKYEWVKLLRARLPEGKGMMAYWAKLASCVAFRRGQAEYCGHLNDVTPGMWSGGVVGLKSILGVKKRQVALDIMTELSKLGYITYDLDEKTKKLNYRVNDWVVKCSGEDCIGKAVYATDGYGFLCLPRNITERLAEQNYRFDEADAWLDLWCHTVFQDPTNAFSYLAPTVQYGKYGAVLTLETLGERWNWEKTKVWRFIQKHGDVFALYRLPGNYGCVLYNKLYPTGTKGLCPTQEAVEAVFDDILGYSDRTKRNESTREYLNRLVAWYSRRIVRKIQPAEQKGDDEKRIALSDPIIRAYLSQCPNCKNCRYDCKRITVSSGSISAKTIREPCQTDLALLRLQKNE